MKRTVLVGPLGTVEVTHDSERFQRVTNDPRPAQKCLKCGQRPRKLPYTRCHICRLSTLRDASIKGWKSRKKMQRARERS